MVFAGAMVIRHGSRLVGQSVMVRWIGLDVDTGRAIGPTSCDCSTNCNGRGLRPETVAENGSSRGCRLQTMGREMYG